MALHRVRPLLLCAIWASHGTGSGKAALKRLLAYVEAARRDDHSILDDAVSVHEYEPGTWGPRSRNKKVPRGDIWPDPEPPDAG